MHSEHEPTDPTSDINPFTPPVVSETRMVERLGIAYWSPIAFAFTVSLALSLSQDFFPIGWIGVLSSIFAAYHGLMYQHRLSSCPIDPDHVVRIPDIALSMGSMLLGLLATTAGGIAFVATCLPAGLVLSLSDGYMAAIRPSILSIVLVACGAFALVCVHLLIRLFVPRKHSKASRGS